MCEPLELFELPELPELFELPELLELCEPVEVWELPELFERPELWESLEPPLRLLVLESALPGAELPQVLSLEEEPDPVSVPLEPVSPER